MHPDKWARRQTPKMTKNTIAKTPTLEQLLEQLIKKQECEDRRLEQMLQERKAHEERQRHKAALAEKARLEELEKLLDMTEVALF